MLKVVKKYWKVLTKVKVCGVDVNLYKCSFGIDSPIPLFCWETIPFDYFFWGFRMAHHPGQFSGDYRQPPAPESLIVFCSFLRTLFFFAISRKMKSCDRYFTERTLIKYQIMSVAWNYFFLNLNGIPCYNACSRSGFSLTVKTRA